MRWMEWNQERRISTRLSLILCMHFHFNSFHSRQSAEWRVVAWSPESACARVLATCHQQFFTKKNLSLHIANKKTFDAADSHDFWFSRIYEFLLPLFTSLLFSLLQMRRDAFASYCVYCVLRWTDGRKAIWHQRRAHDTKNPTEAGREECESGRFMTWMSNEFSTLCS